MNVFYLLIVYIYKILFIIYIYFKVFIDSNGDAEGNYSVIALMEDFTMNETFKMSMQPVGFFQYNTSSTIPHLPVGNIL